MYDLSTLNDAQREAVLVGDGPLLVLAGAGSGKTRVLTTRIAHLVCDCGVEPWRVLAVTFTNKAAREMRERLEAMLSTGVRGMWISTFHSMCARMLRSDAAAVGFERDFAIYDADDSRRLMKECIGARGWAETLSVSTVMSRISELKNTLVAPEDFHPRAGDYLDKCIAEVYPLYQHRLERAGAMDFDDLLMNAYRLLAHNGDICHSYAERFTHVLVDEYQDTNKAQYEIVKLLASVHRNLMVVGDDDQSIYSWRGADISNILGFTRDWPDAHVVTLEQNYRSTGTILGAANAVISHNAGRTDKELFTTAGDGEKIVSYLASDERDEASWLAGQIEHLHDGGLPYGQIAVFYRTNAQSRVLEDMMLRAGVPYRIVGGTRFFERAEIRDVMAYLKLAVNPADDMSFERVVNTPRRGIGKATTDFIAELAQISDISLFEAAREVSLDPATRPAARRSLEKFIALIDSASGLEGSLEEVVEQIVEGSGLVAALEAQKTVEAEGRVENIREFTGVVIDYARDHPFVEDDSLEGGAGDAGPGGAADGEIPEGCRVPTLADFMEWLSLRTDLDALDDGDGDYATLMTVHSAKGLEFDTVFVAGLEEGIFPHRNSIAADGVEEERRLAYVAITRAKKRLVLTRASRRMLFGDPQTNPQSRFLDEIPAELVSTVGIGSSGVTGTGWAKRGDRHSTYGSGRGASMYGGRVAGGSGLSSGGSRSRSAAAGSGGAAAGAAGVTFAVGDRVDHKAFGPGVVEAVSGDKVEVRFTETGKVKKLLATYAPLVKVE